MQAVCLVLLLNFHQPMLLPVVAPIIKSSTGDPGLHYPIFFLALPFVFSRVALVTSVITSLAIAASTVMFAGVFRGKDWHAPWKSAWKRYPALIVTTGILSVVLYLLSKLQAVLPMESQQASSIVRWGTRGGIMALFVLAQGFLIYTTAWIVLQGASLLGSIGRSVRLTWNTFLTTMVLIAIPVILVFPVDYFSGRTDIIMAKFRPELMTGLLGLRILADLVYGFLLVGAITRVFVYQVEESS